MASIRRLGNGLTVVLEPRRTAPVVAFQVWVQVGSADEAPGEVGLAHLHEHMLFKGTARRGPGEIARSVEAAGGEINAWTSFDDTVYHVVMASRHRRQGLDVLADAIRCSAFDAGELEREIEVVCEEIKRSQDMPSRRSSKALFAEAFRVHPYGRPVIGFEDEVRAHTRERVLAFYRRHYRPGNLVLSAVGDFEEEALLQEVEAAFGGEWDRPATGPAQPRPAEPPLTEVRVRLQEEDVKEVHLHLAFPIPGVRHPGTAALDVLAMVLGQGDASRLSLEVRRRRALAKDASAWAWTPRDAGLFGLSLVAAPETAARALEASLEVLASLAAGPVEAAEVATVQRLIEAEAVYQRETAQGLARKLGYYQAVLGDLAHEAAYYRAVAAVTPQALVEAARTLRLDRVVVTGLLPAGTALGEAAVREALARVRPHPPAALPRRPAPPVPAAPSRARAGGGLTVATLSSGARVVVQEERSVPLFAVRATFPGGLRAETEADNGLTALLSRSLTRGTAALDAEAVSHLVDDLAGSLGAAAGRSSLSLRGEFLSRNLEPAFSLFADVLLRPAFPEAEVARERELLLQDIASRDDRPSSVAFELFTRTLFQRHPYRLPALGERASVERLGPAALLEHHRRALAPGQATLVVVGDVDTARVLELAEERLGGPAKPPLALAPPAEPAWTGPREARAVLARAQTHLVLGFVGARVTDPWRRALEVLQTILSGQSGRLFLELRDRRSMAYSVSASSLEGVDPGAFWVYLGTSPDKVPAALEGVRAELDRVRQAPVSPAELDRAREHLIGTHAIGLQRNGARAGLIALDTCYGLGPQAFERYPEEIAAVTAGEVQAVAMRVIDFERSALAVVGPGPGSEGR